jgi:retron-type reverse transcriptase
LALMRDMKSGTYQPIPLRRVYIALLTVLKKMDIRSVHAERRLKAAYL